VNQKPAQTITAKIAVIAALSVAFLAACAVTPPSAAPASTDVPPTDVPPTDVPPTDVPAPTDVPDGRPAGWTDQSHGDDADPDYDTVFPAGEVKVFTITLSPADWQAVQDDLAANLRPGVSTAGYTPSGCPPRSASTG
jgi:hypothetical protein